MTSQSEWLKSLGRASNYNRWVFKSIEPYLCGNALEIGCGTGTFSALIAEAVEHLTAIDISQEFIDTARRRHAEVPNLTLLKADATEDLPDHKFDSIVMLDVLEHIADDAVMLTSLKNKLAPGGRIVLKIPAIPRLFNSLDAAVGHFRRYDQNTLTLAAHSAGCTVRYCRSFNIVGIPGWWWNGVRQRVVAPGAQISGFDKLVPILAFGEKFLPPMPGLSLIGVLEVERPGHRLQSRATDRTRPNPFGANALTPLIRGQARCD